MQGKISRIVKGGGNLTFQTLLVGKRKAVQVFWREIWHMFKIPRKFALQNLQILGIASSQLETYRKEIMKVHEYLVTKMFTVALFLTTEMWKKGD